METDQHVGGLFTVWGGEFKSDAVPIAGTRLHRAAREVEEEASRMTRVVMKIQHRVKSVLKPLLLDDVARPRRVKAGRWLLAVT
jgi:hypothetical protein